VTAAPLTLGTAGHIDHGKTALVAALTGVDTDRLPEERTRGMSIELGYAPLELPSGRRLSVVDVPGHERFVRTMVAGATGIDLFLMTVAADDGVMPQTREHAAVLAALGVTRGVVAITKADRADPAAAAATAAELLPATEQVACSARTGDGIAALAAALDRVAAMLPGRGATPRSAVLHVDRAFTIHGAGTVVTGTLWAGSVAAGDTLVLQPAGHPVRVRSVQVHDAAVARAEPGQRVALNLVGIALRDVRRGDALVAADAPVRPTLILDCALELRGARRGARVQVHHGTRDAAARLVAVGEGLWQLRLEQPLLAADGDRLVVRSVAPPDTLGGGTVLDARARRHGRRPEIVQRLQRLARGEPATPAPPSLAELGAAAAELPALRAAGLAVRVGRDLHAHPDALADVAARITAVVEAEGAITLARLRDELGTSRKFAQALLQHLDAARVTKRLPDDSRVLRGAR
jgi:selenocysteine-specific elongation factor